MRLPEEGRYEAVRGLGLDMDDLSTFRGLFPKVVAVARRYLEKIESHRAEPVPEVPTSAAPIEPNTPPVPQKIRFLRVGPVPPTCEVDRTPAPPSGEVDSKQKHVPAPSRVLAPPQ